MKLIEIANLRKQIEELVANEEKLKRKLDMMAKKEQYHQTTQTEVRLRALIAFTIHAFYLLSSSFLTKNIAAQSNFGVKTSFQKRVFGFLKGHCHRQAVFSAHSHTCLKIVKIID